MTRRRGFNHFGKAADALGSGMHDLIEKVSFDIEAGAANDAPVDTGALADSYDFQFVGPLETRIGSNMEYAPHQEYGWLGNPGQPHLRPAAERVKTGLGPLAKRTVGGAIERAVGRG